jgi:hypothetical protein
MKQLPSKRVIPTLLALTALSSLLIGCNRSTPDTSNSAPAAPPAGGKAPTANGSSNMSGQKMQAAPAPPP